MMIELYKIFISSGYSVPAVLILINYIQNYILKKNNLGDEDKRDIKQLITCRKFVIVRIIIVVILAIGVYKDQITIKIILAQTILLIVEAIQSSKPPSIQQKSIWGNDAYERKITYNMVFSFLICVALIFIYLPSLLLNSISIYSRQLVSGLCIMFLVNFGIFIWVLIKNQANRKMKEDKEYKRINRIKKMQLSVKYIFKEIVLFFEQQKEIIIQDLQKIRKKKRWIILSKSAIAFASIGLVLNGFCGEIKGVDYYILFLTLAGVMIENKKLRIYYYLSAVSVVFIYILILAGLTIGSLTIYLGGICVGIILDIIIISIGIKGIRSIGMLT